MRTPVAFLLVAVAAASAGFDPVPTLRARTAANRPLEQARASDAAAVVPFTIHVPDAVLADLKQRLTRARLPDEIERSGWSYGVNLGYLKELVAYWRDKFDWRAEERRLNQFEQFKTNIDGLNVHFIHRK